MLGSPDAVLRRTVLGDEPDLPRLAVEVHAHQRRVEGSVPDLGGNLPETSDDFRRGLSPRVLRAGHDRLDVGVDVHVREGLAPPRDVRVAEQPTHAGVLSGTLVGKQGEVLGQAFRYEEELVTRSGCVFHTGPPVLSHTHKRCATLM